MSGKNVSFGEEYNYDDDYYDYDEGNAGGYGDDAGGGIENGTREKGEDAVIEQESAGGSVSQEQERHHKGGGSGLFCPNCGGRDIESDMSTGQSICMSCHVVVEENQIVSAVEFAEGPGGASTRLGQFVSSNSSKAFTRNGRYNFSRDSRENTLANGRNRIREIASRMRLAGYFVDAAHRLFTIAVERNFSQGRRTTHVVASCLYIACRQEKSQHMLIDFSDALQVNVYALGTCFLKFRRLLGLKLEIIDPALYVYRFAAHLDLDEKANAVSLTALRLVARMNRDWIVAGRRPAGICAAALLIAARAHGFSKHHQDVTRILRVCGMTVNNRVREFEMTPSANLTLEQFHKVDLETEVDPPAYSRNKIREARVKAIHDGNTALLTSGALDDPLEGQRKSKMYRTMAHKESERKTQLKMFYSVLHEELAASGRVATNSETTTKLLQNGGQATSNQDENLLDSKQGDTVEQFQDFKHSETIVHKPVKGTFVHDDLTDQNPPPDLNNVPDFAVAEEEEVIVEGEDTGKDEKQILVVKRDMFKLPPELEMAHPRDAKGRLLVLVNQATEEELQQPLAPVEAKISLTEWKQTMPESMESELNDIFRTEEEEMQKEAIFNKINKDYIEQQERKDSLRRDQIADMNDEDDVAQAEGHARYKTKRKRKKGDSNGTAATTEEQLRAAVASRKVSRKINYDALSSIFDEDGSLGNVTEDRGNTAGDDAMYEV